MKELSSYRLGLISNAYTDHKIPRQALEYGVNGGDKTAAEAEARADIEALNCSRCENRGTCTYRDKPERLPKGVTGGRGACLRFFVDRMGGNGFFMFDGQPFLIDAEAAAAIRQAVKDGKK